MLKPVPTDSALPFHLHSLAELGRTGNVGVKPILFRILVDFFMSRRCHTASELTQFQAIILGMIADVTPDIQMMAAEKLARHVETPVSIIDYFLYASDTTAAPVIEHCLQLDATILTDTARWGHEIRADALARRASLPDDVAQLLSERPEPRIVQTLVENPDARLTPAAALALVRRAKKIPNLARALLARQTLAVDMCNLYLWADRSRRAEFLLAARRADLGHHPDIMPEPASQAQLAQLEALALRKLWPDFASELAAMLECGPALASTVANDAGGEPLAIALAALGMSSAAAARIFMSLDPAIAHSVERVRTLTVLVKSVPLHTARRLLAQILGTASPRLPQKPSTEARRRGHSLGAGINRATEPAPSHLKLVPKAFASSQI